MSISCKDLIESFKLFDVKAVTMDANGLVTLWSNSEVQYTDYCWKLKLGISGRYMLFGKLEVTEFMNKQPEECLCTVEEPEEYAEWIGKLCWFWNDDREQKDISILNEVEINDSILPFGNYHDCWYQHCRPVKTDEVEFVKED